MPEWPFIDRRGGLLGPFSGLPGGSGFDPSSLFAGGEDGVLFLPSGATCFQDVTGLVPSGNGDPVALMLDMSGNSHHTTQSTTSARPTLRQTAGGLWYLEHDYVDDRLLFDSEWMVGVDLTSSVTFATPTEPDGNNQGIVFGAGTGGVGTNLNIGRSTATQIRGGTYGATPIYDLDWTPDPLSMSITVSSANGRILRYAGEVVDTSSDTVLIDTADTSMIGGYRSFNSRLHFYGGMIIDRELTEAELLQAEQYLAARAGITL